LRTAISGYFTYLLTLLVAAVDRSAADGQLRRGRVPVLDPRPHRLQDVRRNQVQGLLHVHTGFKMSAGTKSKVLSTSTPASRCPQEPSPRSSSGFPVLDPRPHRLQDVRRNHVQGLQYLIHVHTGFKMSAGTKSKVFFRVNGDMAETGVRKMDDGFRQVRIQAHIQWRTKDFIWG